MSSSRAMPSFTWLTLDRCSNCQGCRVSALEVEYTQVEGFAMCIWWLHRTGFIAQQTLSVGIFARCDAVMVMVRAVGAVPKEKEVSVITPRLRQKKLTANHFDIWQCRKRTQPASHSAFQQRLPCRCFSDGCLTPPVHSGHFQILKTSSSIVSSLKERSAGRSTFAPSTRLLVHPTVCLSEG